MATVTFDYDAWVARFPEFAGFPSPLVRQYFDEAGLLCDNSDASLVTDLTQRRIMLWLIVAHMCSLEQSDTVGRITGASEGSVSVSIQASVYASGEWYLQTKYGAQYWQMAASFRHALWVL